jgi:hypothetical protein
VSYRLFAREGSPKIKSSDVKKYIQRSPSLSQIFTIMIKCKVKERGWGESYSHNNGIVPLFIAGYL